MKQITVRQLVRHPSQLEEWLPCEIIRDGEVVAVMLPPNDVRQRTKRNTMSNKLTELPLSKKIQSSGQMARL